MSARWLMTGIIKNCFLNINKEYICVCTVVDDRYHKELFPTYIQGVYLCLHGG